MSDTMYSKPLATLLREGTSQAHETVENSAGAGWLLRGELDKEEYARFLMMLWHVYDTLERALEHHATFPTLQPTFNPALLARAPALAADISYLLQVPESSWKSHPIHTALTSSPAAPLTAYVSRIQELSDSADPSPLLAHAYVRYLGDLSGGQMIRHKLAKAYQLDEQLGLGLAFYAFKSLDTPKPASLGEMRRIKDWFRAGINAGGGDAAVKAAIVREANIAFELNSGLFSDIRAPTEQPVLEAESKEIPIVIEHSAPPDKTYPLASVMSVVAAVCLAHLLLVVGGFTGDRGYQKLLAFEQWFTSTWQALSE